MVDLGQKAFVSTNVFFSIKNPIEQSIGFLFRVAYELFFSSVKTCHFGPINYIEKGLNIIGTSVLVVQVIRVFPYIHT